jgi:hypothetical protein
MKSDLRCLAIRQPFAWAIVAGAKNIENRSWTTEHRGTIVIQASSTKTEINRVAKAHGLPSFTFTQSALIGVADLIDVVPLSEELETNPWAWGPYCWRLANARVFVEPIASKGKLNLYSIEESLAERVRLAIDGAMSAEQSPVAVRWLESMAHHESAEERTEGFLESYLTLGDGENALRLADRRLEGGRTADRLVDRGRARFVADDNDGALADLAAAITVEPENARAYLMRSVVYEMLAEADKERAVELNPAFGDQESGGDDGADES